MQTQNFLEILQLLLRILLPLLILFEFLKYRKDPKVYNINETKKTIFMLLLSGYILPFAIKYLNDHLFLFFQYQRIYMDLVHNVKFRFFNLGDSNFKYLYYFLMADFLYYLIHLSRHKVNLFWTGHSVHHSIKNFNLIEGQRNFIKPLAFQEFQLLFFLPQLLGLKVAAISALTNALGIHFVAVHNSKMPRYRFLEYIFYTPSLHRVHHAMANQNFAKQVNFGGVLSIWDRLFGTFQSELENNHHFGIQDYDSSTTFKMLTSGWVGLFRDLGKARSLRQIFSALFWKI